MKDENLVLLLLPRIASICGTRRVASSVGLECRLEDTVDGQLTELFSCITCVIKYPHVELSRATGTTSFGSQLLDPTRNLEEVSLYSISTARAIIKSTVLPSFPILELSSFLKRPSRACLLRGQLDKIVAVVFDRKMDAEQFSERILYLDGVSSINRR
jgi:hypothetical protein